ncbi:GNAT family N-acetyltransferase [uncultured Cohaesibacter sp.]|uniref:GNAT family N-acetyltransferase n=1 Tax=uncultured Cohaesibacter sp. TaxID=1002546 RepID=UPI00292D8B88|nr:GNAT family N-acetyltransferase [uncultured Cohaesibacter sp.]
MRHVRPVDGNDLDCVCGHRHAMFVEMGSVDEEQLLRSEAPFRSWLKLRLEDGRYYGFIVEQEGKVVAGIGLTEIDWAPGPAHPESERRGLIMNLYVEPGYRRAGIARELVLLAEQEFSRRGLGHAILHASDQGAPLYESLGWEKSSEMAKRLPLP